MLFVNLSKLKVSLYKKNLIIKNSVIKSSNWTFSKGNVIIIVIIILYKFPKTGNIE